MNSESFYLMIMGIISLVFGFVMALNDIWFWESLSYWIMQVIILISFITGYKYGRILDKGSKDD